MIFFLSFFITIDTSAESTEEVTLDSGEVVKVLFEKFSDGYRYEVEFDNGRHYYYQQSGNLGIGGGSFDLTEREKVLAEEAIKKYEQIHGDASTSNRSGNSVGILIILLGLFGTIFPHAAWFLGIGWRLQDAEPSKLALIVNRMGGILLVIVGFFVLI